MLATRGSGQVTTVEALANNKTKGISLKIYEAEVKSSSSASTSTQNIAFASSQNTDITTEIVSAVDSVSAASAKVHVYALCNVDTLSDAVIYSFFATQSNSPRTMTTPRPTPFPATIPRARVFTLFVIISNSDNEITTLPVRPAPPSPDHTPALYGYPLDSGDDSSDEDLSETAKSLHTQIVSTSVVHPPPT
nr:hypothetical protein [Tanacetum cinerariifolium]